MHGPISATRAWLVDYYNLHGIQMRVESNDPALLAEVSRRIGSFRIPQNRADCLTIVLRYAPVPEVSIAPQGMDEVTRCQWAPGVRAAIYTARGRRHIDLLGKFSANLDFDAGHGEICVRPGHEPWIFDTGVMLGIVGCMRRRGQFPMHAACLTQPDGSPTPAAMILVGASEAGKSTTALALARAGMTLETDELTMLRWDHTIPPARLIVWGIPRACRIRPKTLELLPWLKSHPLKPSPGGEEMALELAELNGRSWNPRTRLCRPALIVILDPRNDGGHVIRPIDSAEALMRIAQENVRSLEPGDETLAPAAFQTLGALIRQTPACRLSAGPNLGDLHEKLLRQGQW